MVILNSATAGTQDSNDVEVTIEPGNGSLTLQIESKVLRQFGRQIRQTALETLERLAVTDAVVSLHDNGALNYTIKARVECAVFRSSKQTELISWGGDVR